MEARKCIYQGKSSSQPCTTDTAYMLGFRIHSDKFEIRGCLAPPPPPTSHPPGMEVSRRTLPHCSAYDQSLASPSRGANTAHFRTTIRHALHRRGFGTRGSTSRDDMLCKQHKQDQTLDLTLCVVAITNSLPVQTFGLPVSL